MNNDKEHPNVSKIVSINLKERLLHSTTLNTLIQTLSLTKFLLWKRD